MAKGNIGKPATNRLDLTGRRFGRLSVVSFNSSPRRTNGNRVPLWNCKCQCGNSATASTPHLIHGCTKSCGCLRIKHGFGRNGAGHAGAYSSWVGMRERCNNPKSPSYSRYGGRGITICAMWNDFVRFHSDMGNPAKGMTLERINNSGPYSPENCRWATRKEQQRNTRWNRMTTYNGQTHCTAEWGDILGISHRKITYRLHMGWPVELALSTQNLICYVREGKRVWRVRK
jgi:hypothetical protein